MSHTPILIVGAGPTGLMLSLELSLNLIPHRIIDAATAPSPFSRALVLHSRSLELLARHPGLVEKLTSLGRFNMAVRIFVNKKFVSELDVEEVAMTDTRFPTPLLISQAQIEQVLEEFVVKNGVTIERGLKAETIIQKEDSVVVMVKSQEDGTEEQINCQYVVGCDGAHSIVRKSTGLSFIGDAYPQDFILVDVQMTWSLKHAISIFMGAFGFMAFFPMKDDIWRILCSRVHEKHSESEPTLSDFEQSISQLLPEDANVRFGCESPLWMSRFRLHHRMADNYRQGRCFLAGDAAHIHSPAGGQGMNTGIQDSVNLAWKLAAVLKGERNKTFLETYNIERHRIGKHLLDRTDRGFELMSTSNPIYLWLRNTLVPWVLPLMDLSEASKRSRFRFVSELGIRYRHSPIVSEASNWLFPGIRGGNRMPDCKILGIHGELWLHSLLNGSGYHLVAFSGISESSKSNKNELLIKVQAICAINPELSFYFVFESTPATSTTFNDELGVLHNMLGMSEAGVVLVRPDGYIEWIGNLDRIGELEQWLVTKRTDEISS